MAIAETTIQGAFYAPNGEVATAGEIRFELSESGKVMDGSDALRAVRKYTALIGSDGQLYMDDGETAFKLIPNDAIYRDGETLVGGTVYKAKIKITAPVFDEWEETWEVDSSPDPVKVGAITRTSSASTGWTTIRAQSVSALPTADSSLRRRIAYVPGGTAAEDVAYICMKTASDTYEWVVWANGGA